tara:strand:- start:4860 stop:6821 length:1962 start_codon:yes stop_codon:yes gene_type:complete
MADRTYQPQEITSVLGSVDTFLRWKQAKDKSKRSYKYYHPSEFGKAQPLHAKIQTPTGPISMGDIKIGFEVCAPDSSVSVVDKIHAQGLKEIYRVVFANGDYVECCEDHLWEVDSLYMGFKYPKIMSLKNIMKKYISKSGARIYFLNTPSPIKIHASISDELISSYLMGALLGDGCFNCSTPEITNIDEDLINRVHEELTSNGYFLTTRPSGYHHHFSHRYNNEYNSKPNIYKQGLIKLGLWKIKTSERFVPNMYLYSCIEDRFELIQGLMDTDGTVSKKGYPSFCTTSKTLSQQFKWLIESIGGYCNIYCKKTIGSLAYDCYISYSNPSDLFHIQRKKKRASQKDGRVIRRYIADIIPIGKAETQCITVHRDDGLYLTDHCIITHNCLRKAQYKRYEELGLIKVKHEVFDSKKLRLFDKGHNMHNRWQGYFAEMGILKGCWTCKNPLCSFEYGIEETQGVFCPKVCDECGCERFKYKEMQVFSKELKFRGNVDLILDFANFKEDQFNGVRPAFNMDSLPKKPIVVDMKTANDDQFKRKVLAKGVHPEYIVQLLIYIHLLNCEYGIIIYENKNNSELAAYKIDRDEEKFKLISEQVLLLEAMSETKVLPPPRPKTISDYECKYCEFAPHCKKCSIWNDPDLQDKREKFYKELL